MSNTLWTGITASAVNNYLRGPGKVYAGFTDMNNLGTLLGETRGGSEFEWGLEFHDVEPDGAMGPIKGHRFISKIAPKLTVNLLEHTAANHLKFLPGADSSDEHPVSVKGEYLGTGSELDSGIAPTGATNIDLDTLSVWYTPPSLTTTTWAASTAYSAGDYVVPTTANGYVYKCTTGGTSDTTEPTWPTTEGSTVTDGTAVFTCWAKTAAVATKATITTDYTVNTTTQAITRVSGGSIWDTDLVTASYTYDDTASGDTFTILVPGQIATGDYISNIALVCELTQSTYTNAVVVFIVKNVLSNPAVITIPGERMDETILKTTFEAYFDPDTGLTLDHAPVEMWIGKA